MFLGLGLGFNKVAPNGEVWQSNLAHKIWNYRLQLWTQETDILCVVVTVSVQTPRSYFVGV